jgi:hypothetical protein
MTTFTSEDRMSAENEEYTGGIPIPFAGWMQVDQEDTEAMLREQMHAMGLEIDRWRNAYHKAYDSYQNLYAEFMELKGKG